MVDDTPVPEKLSNEFARQLEEARERLGLPEDATAWQIMCATAAAEVATKDFLRSIFGL